MKECRLIKFKYKNPLHARCCDGHQVEFSALPKQTECQVCKYIIDANADKYTCNEF